MKKRYLFCFFCFLVILPLSFAQQEVPLPAPDPDQPITFNEPARCQIAAPPISPHWQARRSWDYTGMVAGNFDGDAFEEVAFDYGTQGIWIYDPNASPQWNKISGDDPNFMIAVGVGDPTTDELFVKTSRDDLYWWSYNGYPGNWKGITTSVVKDIYDAGNIGDGDTGHELVVRFKNVGSWVLGLWVWDYTGGSSYGGGIFHYIHEQDSSYGRGMPIDLTGDSEYELIHYFSNGLQYWNYATGYLGTFRLLNCNFFEMNDCVACDVDGVAGDEFIGNSTLGLWLYKHGSPGTWTIINCNPALEAWPCAYDMPASDYEVVFAFSPNIGLWEWNADTDWSRINWNVPDFALGADVASAANGGNGGEELIGDFGSVGVWIQSARRSDWTRLNWNDPEKFIPANLDDDPEKELVFDFGGLGVWTWDQATNTWNRINWGSPEIN